MLAAPCAGDVPVKGDPIAVIPNDLLAAEVARTHESMVAATVSANSESDRWLTALHGTAAELESGAAR
jgi:hypothetical protein